MDVTEFVDKYSDAEQGSPLDTAGPMTMRLAAEIGNEGRTRSLLGTNFWQAFTRSTTWFSSAEKLGLSPGALERSRIMVVPRPHLHRFDLLVLDPALPPAAPRHLRVDPDAESLIEGWRAWTKNMARNSWIERFLTPSTLTECAVRNQPFAIVAARAPETEILSVPQPPVEVDARPTVAFTSTAGIVARDKAGRRGVTAALHGVKGATTVLVGGRSGTVLVRDPVSDSCFIELSHLPPLGPKGKKGVMSQMAPRGLQKAEFDGITSRRRGSPTPTIVRSWDLDVPNVEPLRQLRVYTPRDAEPGDSGAALITDDDYVIGFAFDRTKSGKQPEHCTWIWADSVVQALGLEI